MEKILRYFQNIFKKRCTHNAAEHKNCKYCPDCGKKIIYKWIIIRCKCCGHYRKPIINISGKIKPLKKYCFYCGSHKWVSQNYFESMIPDSLKTIAVKKIETEKKYHPTNFDQKTKIWVSLSKDERKINFE